MDHEVKKLKRCRIPIVKVRWESKCGPEFTWEGEDQMKLKGGGMAAEAVATDFYVCPIHKPSLVYHDYISFEDLVRRIRGFGLEWQRFMSWLLVGY
ncbi:hypothetical protein E3N88_18506 [Mikania micrantha]|uniref:Uncharacterized protein n=1 Tax=Mikania micrantha TaxID=192012 RepID=A0A5N6NMA9_9ASTR|nr:hypothetical protein E3N88_18506 [Mikania micrantha]